MRNVLVAGIGSTSFGRHAETDIQALAAQATDAAIRDSGLSRDEVGSLYLGNFISGPLTGQEVLAGLVADSLSLPQIPCSKMEGACASGGIAFRHAYLAVASGTCDVALAVGVEKMTHADTATTTAALNCAMDNRSDGTSGLTFPGLFGLAWQVHANRYGTTRAQVSSVVKKNKANGLRNPLAQMGMDIGDDQIIQSPLICDPLRLFDCCPTSDGAAAVLLVAEDRLRDINATPVRVMAAAQTRGSARIAGHPDLCTFDATVSAARLAYRQAGIKPADVDFVELHDCFSIAEIIDAEDLGLIPRGEGGAYAAEGRTRVDGDRPINASGGLLSKGHPVGATGIGQIYETVLQLRGQHPNQVKNAGIGMTHNLGGTGVACSVNILKRLDA
jgi:acetyl-CoA C-acetyltransferase